MATHAPDVYRPGHYGIALLSYAPVGYGLGASGHPATALLGGLTVLLTTRLPDYDYRVPLIEHRGITHTLLFAVFVGGVLGGLAHAGADALPLPSEAPSPRWFGVVGGGVGTLSILAHLAGDVITPAGIQPFLPLSGRTVSLGIVRADSTVANYLLLGGGVLAAAGATLAVLGVFA